MKSLSQLAALWGLALAGLLVVGPFELRQGIAVGPVTLTSTELVAALAAAVGCLCTLQALRLRVLVLAELWPLRWPVVALLTWSAVHLASTTWAEPPQGEVFKAGLRIAGQMGLAVLTLIWAQQPQFVQRVKLGLLASLAVVTLLGSLERGLGRAFEPVLLQFRDEPTWMLGEQRLSTVFYHANTCAAFLELTAPVLLVATVLASGWRRWVLGAWAATVALLLSVTYSRAGFLAAAAGSLVLVAFGRSAAARPLPQRKTLQWLAGSWALIVVAAYALNPDMRARIGLDERSYRPVYEFDRGCAGHPGDAARVVVRIRNRGAWALANRQAPASLIHTWVTDRGKRVGDGWQFAPMADLPPGQTATVALDLQLPARPGDYVLAVDIFRDRVLRVSAVGAPMGWLGCTVVPPDEPVAMGAANTRPPANQDAVREGRALDLERRHYWRAAVLLWARKPWLGWGSDRFHSIHREYVPAQGFDPRARAHSVVLETAVDLGVLGLGALLALLVILALQIRRTWCGNWQADAGLRIALLAGLAGFGVHSLVDFFLGYTQIAVVVWPMVGVLLRPMAVLPDNGPPPDGSGPVASDA